MSESMTGGLPTWTPISTSQLFKNLEAGTDFHLRIVDAALVLEARNRLRNFIASAFGIPRLELNDKILKKLTNSAMALGDLAVNRTKQAVEELPFWSQKLDLVHISADRQPLFLKSAQLRLEGDVSCEFCSEGFDGEDRVALVEGDYMHFACFVATLVREELSTFRSARVALSKQGRSARSVLSENRLEFPSERSQDDAPVLAGYNAYWTWLESLLTTWSKKTKVNEKFHSLYHKNFHDYCDEVLSYLGQGEDRTSRLKQRLSRYLKSDEVERIVATVEETPVPMLRYFGLQEIRPPKRASLSQYLADEKREELKSVEWTKEALCANTDPALFRGADQAAQEGAIKICSRCPVRNECLDYALKNGETKGIWGGKTPEQRRNLASVWEREVAATLWQRADRLRDSRQTDAVVVAKGAIYNLELKAFADCRKLGEKFREGYNLIVDVSAASEDDQKRAVDFLAGMTFISRGNIQRMAPRVFMVAHPEVVVKSEDNKNDVSVDLGLTDEKLA